MMSCRNAVANWLPISMVISLLVSCGGGGSGGGLPASATYTPKFTFVANSVSNDISVYTIDSSTGALTQVSCGPNGTTGCNGTVEPTNFVAGTSPGSVTVDPSGKFAYVTNSGSGDVSAYTIDATTGALTSIGSAVGAGTNPYSVTVDPTDRFAYVANNGSSDISLYTINASTGALSQVSCGSPGTTGCSGASPPTNFTSGSTPRSIAIDPTGKFAYVANYGGTISVFTIDALSGALTKVGADVTVGGYLTSVTVDPTGSFVYVAEYIVPYVAAYAIDTSTGALTAVSGSPFAAGQNATAYPYSVSVDPSGRFAYVTNYGNNSVTAYTIDAMSGALTRINCTAVTGCTGYDFVAGTNPVSIKVDLSGKFAYVANYGSNNVSVFAIDSVTGVLSSVGTASAAGANPYYITTSGAIH